jgi:hypothetical protein
MLPLDHTTRVVPNCPKFDRVLLLSGSSLQQTPFRYLLVYPPLNQRRYDARKAQRAAGKTRRKLSYRLRLDTSVVIIVGDLLPPQTPH